jgi:chorismate-pyruvate lyase
LTQLIVEDVKELLRPLVDFWSPRDQAFDVQLIAGEDIPQPYRELLVHDRDMTPTLEEFWKSEIALDVLARTEVGGDLMRHVILRTNIGKPVALGAIRIALAPFPAAARADILAARAPLGALLREYAIEHRSTPAGFFRMAPNAMTRQAFGWRDAAEHYGRHNRLSSAAGLLAEVVEILPRLP